MPEENKATIKAFDQHLRKREYSVGGRQKYAKYLNKIALRLGKPFAKVDRNVVLSREYYLQSGLRQGGLWPFHQHGQCSASQLHSRVSTRPKRVQNVEEESIEPTLTECWLAESARRLGWVGGVFPLLIGVNG
ncbi:MAG: hypothetical protein QXJ75_06570 [Candidatus Bathyarchaeia archaeon]